MTLWILLAAILAQSSADKDKARTTVVQGQADLAAGGFTRALERFQDACEAGNADGCVLLATMTDVLKDDAKAAALFQKTCDGGDPLGCIYLAGLYASGRGVPKDEARRAVIFGGVCDAGTPLACKLLGDAYSEGDGVPKDYGRAVSLYERGCDAGVAMACGYLGIMFAEAHGVPEDIERARILVKRGCASGDETSCALVRQYAISSCSGTAKLRVGMGKLQVSKLLGAPTLSTMEKCDGAKGTKRRLCEAVSYDCSVLGGTTYNEVVVVFGHGKALSWSVGPAGE